MNKVENKIKAYGLKFSKFQSWVLRYRKSSLLFLVTAVSSTALFSTSNDLPYYLNARSLWFIEWPLILMAIAIIFATNQFINRFFRSLKGDRLLFAKCANLSIAIMIGINMYPMVQWGIAQSPWSYNAWKTHFDQGQLDHFTNKRGFQSMLQHLREAEMINKKFEKNEYRSGLFELSAGLLFLQMNRNQKAQIHLQAALSILGKQKIRLSPQLFMAHAYLAKLNSEPSNGLDRTTHLQKAAALRPAFTYNSAKGLDIAAAELEIANISQDISLTFSLSQAASRDAYHCAANQECVMKSRFQSCRILEVGKLKTKHQQCLESFYSFDSSNMSLASSEPKDMHLIKHYKTMALIDLSQYKNSFSVEELSKQTVDNQYLALDDNYNHRLQNILKRDPAEEKNSKIKKN